MFRDVPNLRDRFVLYNQNDTQQRSKRLRIFIARNGFFVSGVIRRGDNVFVQAESLVKQWPMDLREDSKRNQLSIFTPTVSFGVGVSKIPYSLIQTTGAFFREVHCKHDTEAMVQLLYSDMRDSWMVRPVAQQCSVAKVTYDLSEPVPRGFSHVGVIHSHNSFPAFHSHTDDEAEKGIDGIYITIGDVHKPTMSISTSVVVCGARIVVAGRELIDSPEFEFPRSWLNSIILSQEGGLTWKYPKL